jgi:uncharacterized protein (TIGR02646 family)
MRNIKKDFSKVPTFLLEQYKKLKNINKSKELDYDDKNSSVKKTLNDFYYGKCAYCESKDELQIEHYRPTNGVTEDKTHDGYYWLEVEWSNLLLSCYACNKQGSKGNHFPLFSDESLSIKENRVKNPLFSKQGFPTNHNIKELDEIEQPLLINPEVTNPYEHLRINKFGSLKEINNSIEGKTTREVCKLNRNSVFEKRATIINNFVNRIETQLKKRYQAINPLTAEQLDEQLFLIFEDIAKQGEQTMEFTMISYSMIKYFDDMVLDNFEPEFHEILHNAFLEFCGSF